jgi:hypothetical protein
VPALHVYEHLQAQQQAEDDHGYERYARE